MKSLAFLVALTLAGAALASPAGDIAGTWECRQPGVQYRNKPPILYVADAGDQVTIEVDGFAREIYGRAELAADQGGWWKVKPAQGQEFLIRPEGVPAKLKTASMGLSFADGKPDFRCLRLPPSGATTFAPAGAPAAESPVPAPAEPAPGAVQPAPAEPALAPAPSGEPAAPPGLTGGEKYRSPK